MPYGANMGDRPMNRKDFEGLMAGLNDALSYAKGKASPAAREHRVKVDRSFVGATRLKAGLTQEEFAKVTGASLGTVRKWERGERIPSGAAGMLIRILAREPKLVIREAGLAQRKSRGQRRAKAA
jgi:putative transcriptional regulator